ncbi:MAG TPA: hypothetical protein VLN57_18400 [Xanthobacteraceae bacterium]|nr:hypothetical protein [Xanthobacteraceae bacterium]
MRIVIITCAALLGMVASPAYAQKGDASAKQKFVVALQNAIRADDKNWLADHMSYPVNYFGKQKVVIRSKTSFINNYASLVTPKLRVSVLAQDPASVFENWQGAMIGGGNENIWITQVGDSRQRALPDHHDQRRWLRKVEPGYFDRDQGSPGRGIVEFADERACGRSALQCARKSQSSVRAHRDCFSASCYTNTESTTSFSSDTHLLTSWGGFAPG